MFHVKLFQNWPLQSTTSLPIAFICASVFAPSLGAQQFDPSLFNELRWRMIGPFRGGRVLAVTGVPGHPHVFYFGGGRRGLWNTNGAVRSGTPLFRNHDFPLHLA